MQSDFWFNWTCRDGANSFVSPTFSSIKMGWFCCHVYIIHITKIYNQVLLLYFSSVVFEISYFDILHKHFLQGWFTALFMMKVGMFLSVHINPCPHEWACVLGTTSCLDFLSLLKQCYQIIVSHPLLPSHLVYWNGLWEPCLPVL